jgi:hypothetical protein
MFRVDEQTAEKIAKMLLFVKDASADSGQRLRVGSPVPPVDPHPYETPDVQTMTCLVTPSSRWRETPPQRMPP